MKILFVCTGNIFRSMSAEYLAAKYIKDNKINNIQISKETKHTKSTLNTLESH
jgi:protein-tyrosine-phosphatase